MRLVNDVLALNIYKRDKSARLKFDTLYTCPVYDAETHVDFKLNVQKFKVYFCCTYSYFMQHFSDVFSLLMALVLLDWIVLIKMCLNTW
jgi:hypothetical protein